MAKNIAGHDGNGTYNLWNGSTMFEQLSYVVRSIQVCDISSLSQVLRYQSGTSIVQKYTCCAICQVG